MWYVYPPELPGNAQAIFVDQAIGKNKGKSKDMDTVRQASVAIPAHLGRFETLAHAVFGVPLAGNPARGVSQAIFALGCFWGAERKFWQTPGVCGTAVGYTGGFAADPDYYSVCSGATGHAEAVLVSYQVSETNYRRLLGVFWEAHDPTQGMRQGADVGTQYRSAIFTLGDGQQRDALASRQAYGQALQAAGHGPVTTEIADAGVFYFAEGQHQQYLAGNPHGYCGLGGTGVACDLQLGTAEESMEASRA